MEDSPITLITHEKLTDDDIYKKLAQGTPITYPESRNLLVESEPGAVEVEKVGGASP